MAKHQTLDRQTLLQRLAALAEQGKVVLDPAALFREPGSLGPGPAALAGGPPGRLYLCEPDHLPPVRELPEAVSPPDLAAWLEGSGGHLLDSRFLPLDHPEGIIARLNCWFYVGQAERAFDEGGVPTGLARDANLARAEAALLAGLAGTGGRPSLLQVGAGCEVESLKAFFQELARRDGALAAACEIHFSDYSPALLAEAKRLARLDPELRGLVEGGRLRFRPLDATRPELGAETFTLIHSGYVYDSLPQRVLARVGGGWFELKARPRLPAWPELEEFRGLLLAEDAGALHEVPTDFFNHLDWQVVLDPLAEAEVPYRALLEETLPPQGDLCVPLSDALINGFEAVLPHLQPGGAIQTFDAGVASLGTEEPARAFKEPGRTGTGALFVSQNFALARKVFEQRGLLVSHLPADDYLEETLGEEVLCCQELWGSLVPEALEEFLGAEFIGRFRGCLEGKGGAVYRGFLEGYFLSRSEGAALAGRLEGLGLEGREFVRGLFAARQRLRDPEGTYEQFRVSRERR